MSYVIKFLGLRNGGQTFADGQYLKSYDPAPAPGAEGYDGGKLDITRDPAEALRFDSHGAAMEFWRTQAPEPFDLRPDGLPNRPLTAFSISIEPTQSHPA